MKFITKARGTSLHLNEVKQLQSSLADYGLSPSEWTIKKQTQGCYKIENKSDPNFIFNGYIDNKNGSKKWERIYLKSI